MKNRANAENLEKIRARAKAIEEKRPGHKEILQFFAAILTEQCLMKSRVKNGYEDIKKEAVKAKNGNGLPLIDKTKWKIDGETAAILFRKLTELVSKRSTEMAGEVERIKKGH